MRFLHLVDDWDVRGEKAGFRVTSLAAVCGVTDRHLRRYFQQTVRCPPGRWLVELQLWTSISLLFDGRTMKEVSVQLGFTSPSNSPAGSAGASNPARPSSWTTDPAMHDALARLKDQIDTADGGPSGALARLRAGVRVKLSQRLAALRPTVTRPANRRSKAE